MHQKHSLTFKKGTDEMAQQLEHKKLIERITVNPKIFGGKPIIRGRRLAVEHVLGLLAAQRLRLREAAHRLHHRPIRSGRSRQ